MLKKCFLLVFIVSSFFIQFPSATHCDEAFFISNVPAISQLPNFPTGCEVVALEMLLRYNGFEYTTEDLISILPTTKKPFYENGVLKGGHPDDAFIGSPYDERSFGVYAPVILRLIEEVSPGESKDLTGQSFEDVLNFLKEESQPIMMWVTMRLAEPKKTLQWQTPKGSFQWIAPEHVVLLIGYDKNHVYANDPITGKLETYDRKLFELRWNEMGKQAASFKVKQNYKTIVFKSQVLEHSPKACIKGGKVWFPISTLEPFFSNLTIYKSMTKENDTVVLLNGELFLLRTGQKPFLNVKVVDGVLYVDNLFLSHYLHLQYILTPSQLRLFQST